MSIFKTFNNNSKSNEIEEHHLQKKNFCCTDSYAHEIQGNFLKITNQSVIQELKQELEHFHFVISTADYFFIEKFVTHIKEMYYTYDQSLKVADMQKLISVFYNSNITVSYLL